MRIQSAPSAQPSEAASDIPNSPVQSKVSQKDPQLATAQSPARSAAPQPSRFASEASQEADISNGDSAFTQGQYDNSRKGASQQGPAVARGLSDTPWLGGEAEHTSGNLPAQQQFVSQQSLGANSVASSDGRQDEGFSRAGRLQEQPQRLGQGFVEQPQEGFSGAGRLHEQSHSPGQGFVEQPQDGRSSFGSDSTPGLSGVKQVWQLFKLSAQTQLHEQS